MKIPLSLELALRYGIPIVAILVAWLRDGRVLPTAVASVLTNSCSATVHDDIDGRICYHNVSTVAFNAFNGAVTSNSSSTSSSQFDAQAMFEVFLAEDYDVMDPDVLPRSIKILKKRGAHHSWHKHSTFLQHLLGVHNILRLWGQGAIIGRVGLFHSAYSNSYVNLALFDPNLEGEREMMRQLVGSEAESLVYLFCTIDRQAVVINTLLKQGIIPKEGLIVPHIRNATEKTYLSPETLRMLVVFTMADTADQYFGWQDELFGGGGYKGSMIIPGQDFEANHRSRAIWPGLSRPGLWMSYLSQLGQVARTFRPEWKQHSGDEHNNTASANDDFVLVLPPIFESCTRLLAVENEAEAIDLYWSVMTNELQEGEDWKQKTERDIDLLNGCIAKNPWIFEPHVLLAQKYLHLNRFDEAKRSTQQALKLQMQWGTPWDKRLAFGGWVAWTRVLRQLAHDQKPWPQNSWEVNNLGLVRNVAF
ncbi:hypothetical protein ACA910_000555 [Epithemia clementina (nom. ined.)]